MPKFICDRSSYAISDREYTDEGFLRVPGNVARAENVQEYYAKELGLTDRDPFDVVYVYRPSEEVFKKESLDSYNGVDVTNNHPSTMVDSKSFKAVSVGNVRSNGRQEGDFVVADLIIKDANAIKAVESGKVQLSAGYTADYEEKEGYTPLGQKYDFIQRNIKINHVALVDQARAGGQARLFDNKGALTMPIVTLDNGRTVTLDNEANAALIGDAFDRMRGIIDTQKDTIDSLEQDNQKLSSQTTDSAIAKRVKAVSTTMDTARKIAGRSFSCDSVDVTEIQRAALKAIGRKNMDGKSAAYVQGVFDNESEQYDEDMEEMRDMLKEMGHDEKELKDMSKEEMKDMLEKENGDEAKDSHRRFAADANPNKETRDGAVTSPYAKLKLDRASAWKGKE